MDCKQSPWIVKYLGTGDERSGLVAHDLDKISQPGYYTVRRCHFDLGVEAIKFAIEFDGVIYKNGRIVRIRRFL